MQTATLASATQQIKQAALAAGFDYCGVAKAGFMEAEARQLETWLKQERHGKMHYMANHFDARTDPRQLLPGARSVISVLKNYYPAQRQAPTLPQIASYAYGDDYHHVMKQQLAQVVAALVQHCGDVATRCCVDSAPVLDKAWAARAGLGWIGKNTNLIRPQAGSFYFIGEIITDAELAYDSPIGDYCGTCTKCLDACPTQALTPYQIDAKKCISYLTIELKENMPEQYRGQTAGWAYGCDICQDVCPWNSFATPHSEPRFEPQPHTELDAAGWQVLSASQFKKLTRRTAMSRVKQAKMLDNLDALTGQEA